MRKVPKVKVSCYVCGKEIEKYMSQVQQNTSGRFFCCIEHLRQVGPKPRGRNEIECAMGGHSFYPKSPVQRFCSRDCANRWQARNRVQLKCEQCGKDFTLSPSQAEHMTGRWCTRDCEAASRIKRPLNREYNGKPAVRDKKGYVRVYVPDHPRATKAGWQFEHRVVVEEFLGRLLARDEHVHHINGIKDDNRLENLIVMSHSEHSTITGNGREAIRAAMAAELEQYRKRFGSLH